MLADYCWTLESNALLWNTKRQAKQNKKETILFVLNNELA
jgi:hypothetical protein